MTKHKTALILVDFQAGILATVDAHHRTDAVARASKLVNEARACGVPVMHVGVARLPRRGPYDSPRTDIAHRVGAAPRDMLPLAPGAFEGAFVIEPMEGENVFFKIGVSAFAGTALDLALRSEGVGKVLIAGIHSHMAVESTVRQGFDLGYTMVVARNACAGPSVELHERAFHTLPFFSRVMPVSEICTTYLDGSAV